MKTLLLAIGLASAAATPRTASAPSPAASAPAPSCAAGATDAAMEPACRDAPLCSARERVAVACELRAALEARYVFRTVKRATLARDGGAVLDVAQRMDACVADERAIAREEDPLRFYDRMRACVAALEDGHLILTVPGGLPPVSLGLELRVTGDGKVHVANLLPALVRRLETEGGVAQASSLLAPGTQVLAVDGVPVADVLSRLERLVPGGSAAARVERAVDALTRRDFAYPERRSATLTVLHAGARRDLELPWWIGPGADRNPLAAAYQRRVALPTTDLVDWSSRPRWAAGPGAGAGRGDTILARDEARLLREYRADSGFVAARLGEPARAGGAPFCYAQLLTMHTDSLSSGAERRPFVDVLEEFVAGCAARQLDLVLDLRQNEGGFISHSTALARMLTPSRAPPPRGALLLRANDHNEAVFRARAPLFGGVRALWNGARSDVEEILSAIEDARGRGDEFTPAFLDGPRRDSTQGFDGRVVALVAPTCMSACERLAAMLHARGATLVGGPTEGAGGSQQEAKGLPARWTDSARRLSLSVPTAAMGVARDADAARTATASRFFSEMSFENRPFAPDVPYATTVDDLTRENRGWREAAEAALEANRRTGGDLAARGAAGSLTTRGSDGGAVPGA